MAGAVLVPINTRMKGAEAADILERSRRRCSVQHRRLPRPALPGDAGRTAPADLETVVVVGSGSAACGRLRSPGPISSARRRRRTVRECTSARRRLHADSTADLMFTSGTTGRPKGVMAAHGRPSGPSPNGHAWSGCGEATAT
jgi:long-subunit acyl-CoA synthetase (AMP-forming)